MSNVGNFSFGFAPLCFCIVDIGLGFAAGHSRSPSCTLQMIERNALVLDNKRDMYHVHVSPTRSASVTRHLSLRSMQSAVNACGPVAFLPQKQSTSARDTRPP